MKMSWVFKRFRWAYILLVGIITIQSYLLYVEDSRNIILMSLSLIPTLLYITFVRFSDVGEKEPRGAVAFGIFIGILLIYPAIYFERFGIRLVNDMGYYYSEDYFSRDALVYLVLLSFPVISLIEEGLKFIAFILTFSFSKENDQPTDSIVYTVAISGGFALFENYRYVLNASEYTFEHGYIVALVRTLTAIPLHLGVGLVMGIYLSKFFYPKELDVSDMTRNKCLLKAIIYPFLIHGFYDFIVFASFSLFLYIDIVLALIFALILTWISWKKTMELREKVEVRYKN